MGGVIKVNVRCANRGLGVIAISSARPPLRRSRGIRIKFEGIRSITKKNMIGQQASVVFFILSSVLRIGSSRQAIQNLVDQMRVC